MKGLNKSCEQHRHHDDDDRFYILLFSALEQTHCAFAACAFKLGTSFSLCILNIHWSGVLKHCLIVTWLVPHETAAISPQVLCTPYKHAPVYSVTSCTATCLQCHFMQSHAGRVHACLAVRLLHFWQNEWDLLVLCTTTVVTWVWNRYRNKSQHRKLTLDKKMFPPFLVSI